MPRGPVDGASRLGRVLGFLQAVWALDHGLQSASKRMETAIGLTGPQRLVVRVIGRSPGITAGRLAGLLHLHPSTLTGVLHRLERRGILRRVTDRSDARRAFLHLTSRGRALDRRRTGTVEAAVRRALLRVPASRISAAQGLLRNLADELLREHPHAREPR